jgi:PD-(D/E)XK nuclease superfamily
MTKGRIEALNDLMASFETAMEARPVARRASRDGLRIEELEATLRGLSAVRKVEQGPRRAGLAALLDAFRESDVPNHLARLEEADLLGIFGQRTLEIPLSRSLRWLIDPRQAHGKAHQMLQAVWGALEMARAARQPELAPLGPAPSQILAVRREVSGDEAKIDIEVIGDDALVHIENKPYSGETQGDQTVREWGDLQRRSQALGIPRSRAVGVFLTPWGVPAASDRFIRLSYLQLAAAIRGLADQEEDAKMKVLLGAIWTQYRRVALGREA